MAPTPILTVDDVAGNIGEGWLRVIRDYLDERAPIGMQLSTRWSTLKTASLTNSRPVKAEENEVYHGQEDSSQAE